MTSPGGEPWTLEAFTAGAKTEAVWSTVAWSEIPSDLRFEPEYHQPHYIELESQLEDVGCDALEKLAVAVNSGPFGSNLLKSLYEDDGVVVLRPFNIKDATIGDDDLAHISEKTCQAQGLPIYEPESVAFARVGDMRCGIIPDFGKPLTISPNIIVAKLDSEKVNPYYLAVFMNTRLGFSQLQRAMKVVAQPTITVETVKSLQVPRIPLQEQAQIESILKASLRKRLESQDLYAQAEMLLLAELSLDDLDLAQKTAYTQGFCQAWKTGRLDAEHFQPRYYALLARLEETGQAVRLGDWIHEPIRRGVQPEYDESGSFIVINSQHVGKTHVELEDNRRTKSKFAQQNERAIVRLYDVLLNSTGYITIGRCQTLLDGVQAIVDGHVSIIRPRQGLDPVYLGLFLNSLPGQMQTERSWTGSSGQIELRSELIENYTVWKPEEVLQQQIRNMVEEAHEARQESQRLLDEAKQRVEAMVLGEGK